MGRRFRWHEFFLRFDVHIVYVKCSDNVVADALSQYAYPAGQAFKDISRHGSTEDLEEVERIKAEEKEMESEKPNHEEWLEGDEMHPSATELPGDGPVAFVRPVGTPSGTPEKGPLRFEFKTPRIPRSGQQLRPEEEPGRKSPPPREVGPREEAPEGDEQQAQPEISQGDQGSQGGEPVDAPLG